MWLLSLFSSKNLVIAAIIFGLSSLWYAQIQKMRYNAIVSEYALFRQKQADLVTKIEELNALKAEYAKKQIIEATIKHQAIIESIKNEYNRSQKSNIATISDLRSQLRDSLTSANSLPDIETDTELTAEKWRNNYTAIAGQYQTLKTACAITTQDYNTLRDWADASCEQVGCN